MWKLAQAHGTWRYHYREGTCHLHDNVHSLTDHMVFEATDKNKINYYWIQVHSSIAVIVGFSSNYHTYTEDKKKSYQESLYFY